MVAPEDDFPARPEHRAGRALFPFLQQAQSADALLGDWRRSLAQRGAAAFVFGFAFLWPDLPDTMVIRLFAAYLLVDGVLALTPGGWASSWRLGWPLLIGGCIDIAGACAIYVSLWSGTTLSMLAHLAMLWAIASGIAFTLAGATLRRSDTDHLFLAGGIASLVFGRAMLSHFATDAIVLSAWMGLFALTMAALFLKLAVKHYRVVLL